MGARLISWVCGGKLSQRAGSWPLAFRHWPTKLNNRRYVIVVRVCRQPGGKGGKSANGKQRRSKKMARDECREAGRLWRSITYVRESVTPRDEDALFFLSFHLSSRHASNILAKSSTMSSMWRPRAWTTKETIPPSHVVEFDTRISWCQTGRTPIWSLNIHKCGWDHTGIHSHRIDIGVIRTGSFKTLHQDIMSFYQSHRWDWSNLFTQKYVNQDNCNNFMEFHGKFLPY